MPYSYGNRDIFFEYECREHMLPWVADVIGANMVM